MFFQDSTEVAGLNVMVYITLAAVLRSTSQEFIRPPIFVADFRFLCLDLKIFLSCDGIFVIYYYIVYIYYGMSRSAYM